MIVSLILLIPLLLTNMGDQQLHYFVGQYGAGDPHRKYGTGGYSNGKIFKVATLLCIGCKKENVVHRVVEIQEDGKIITKGDNNENADFAPVTQAQVCGESNKMPWGFMHSICRICQ